VLEDAGYQIDSATTVSEALEYLHAGQYDAYLIDLVMPNAGGLEVIRAARQLSPSTPLVVMTAEPEHLVPKRAGMDYYLHKPFPSLLALEQAIRRAIREGAHEAAVSLHA
jgi:CheY-like chemotaxis protein